jgi:hypothetical protein
VRTVALGLLLAFGVVAVGCGVFLLSLTFRRRRHPFVLGIGAFFVVQGALALTAFAVPAARRWAGLAIAGLLIARGLVFFAVRRRAPSPGA